MFSGFDGGDLIATIMSGLSLVMSIYAIRTAYELHKQSARQSREHSFTDMFLHNFDVMSQRFHQLVETVRHAETYAADMALAGGYGPKGLYGLESMVAASMIGSSTLLSEIKARASANFRLVRMLNNQSASIHAKVSTLVTTLNAIDATIENIRPPDQLLEILYGRRADRPDVLFQQWRKAMRETQVRVQTAYTDACLATIELAQAELK